MSPAIPVIDLRHREDRQRLTDEIRHACEDLGFFQLRNYTIPDFFCLPVEIKEKYDRGKLASNIHTGDLKEGFFLGRHLPLDDPDVEAGKFGQGPNNYPAIGTDPQLSRDTDALRRFCTKPIATLHLLHYPPQAPDASELERGVHYQSSRIRLPTTNELTLLAGIGAHSDFGAITILLQDSVGGSTDFLVECLESCLEPGKEPKYSSVTVHDWIVGRYADTFGGGEVKGEKDLDPMHALGNSDRWPKSTGCTDLVSIEVVDVTRIPNIPTIARTDRKDLGELAHRDMECKQCIDSKRHAASAGSTRTTLKMNPDCSCGLPSAQGRF
ncbi:Clavaminate synthase-like protein [Aspergillus niger CBS 101883]|uniref:Clavaminate synthase-like protein n=1 Tax=Aspergillus lacticoffeatus (strain CBS 101883) TaxID=1450533 RepID=UPI000D7FBEC5|nr:Clavaminate synthase-like protein [Aspergillus niger CBS 101883]PYH53288.1 Clavaminate synthase-like protein [Aspergillus niger CBS 101883]